jgi:hypothetical protein
LIGNDGGIVSGVFNLGTFGVEAPDRRPRHDEHYHEACVSVRELYTGLQSFRSMRRIVPWSDRLFRSPLSERELTPSVPYVYAESNFRHTQVETDRVAGHDEGGPGVASNSPPSGKERGRASIIAPVGMLELSRINSFNRFRATRSTRGDSARYPATYHSVEHPLGNVKAAALYLRRLCAPKYPRAFPGGHFVYEHPRA